MVPFMLDSLKVEAFSIAAIVVFTVIMMLVEPVSAVIVFATLFILESFRWKTVNIFRFPEGQQLKFYSVISAMLICSIFI
tara:strand:- start:5 stop:244 length:240 start_codon:yes stop_codon:yes gene_type:complete